MASNYLKNKFFPTIEKIKLFNKTKSFFVLLDKGLNINDIDSNIINLTGKNKNFYIGHKTDRLLNFTSNLKIDSYQKFYKHLTKKNKSINTFHVQLKITEDANLKSTEKIIQNVKSDMIRTYGMCYSNKIEDGYLLLFRLLLKSTDRFYFDQFYKDFIIVLDNNDSILDFNENFYLRFHKIFNAKKIMGSNINNFIDKTYWEKIIFERNNRINKISNLLKQSDIKWDEIYNYNTEINNKKDWILDQSSQISFNNNDISCYSKEDFSYIILNKELDINTFEYKAEFVISENKDNNFWFFLFGHNNPQNYSPDNKGYLIGIQNNFVTIKKQTLVKHRSKLVLPKTSFHFSITYRHGGIQIYVNNNLVSTYIDPFPVYPDKHNRYCGLAFSYKSTFSNLRLFRNSLQTPFPKSFENETIVKLKYFENEIYNAEIIPGQYFNESVSFIYLKELTNQLILDQLRKKAEQAEKKAEKLYQENIRLKELAEDPNSIIGNSEPIKKIKSLINQVADSFLGVLILGETGTGKDLAAHNLHILSKRSGPFIKVDCASMPKNLLESELFGHEKGAFTGAINRHIGRIEKANNGTLFLDEIGNLSSAAQAKLLRIIQDKELERLGGEKTLKVDVRIIAATNKNLEKMISKGLFRKDLFFRLNVIRIEMPPLRDRKNDILPLINYYISKKYKDKYSNQKIDQNVLNILKKYNWPGNIRELFNCLDYMITVSDDKIIKSKDIPEEILKNKKVMKTQTKEHNKDLMIALSISDNNLKLASAFLQKPIQHIQSQTDKLSTNITCLPTKNNLLLDQRNMKILGIIFREWPITINSLSQKTNIRIRTLQRILNKLLKTDLISKIGNTRSTKYVWNFNDI